MNTSVISKENQTKIAELFETMDDSPGIESDKLVKDWLRTHDNSFSGFINNKFLPKPEDGVSRDDENVIYSVQGEETIKAACLNFEQNADSWYSLPSSNRSSYLYSIADTIEKNSELFAQVESFSLGKQLYRTKTKDVPNLIQSFNYYAGIVAEESQHVEKDGSTNGIVCVVADKYNNTLPSLSWRVASTLAAGNAVLLLVEVGSCTSAFLLAELCRLSGLPAGVLNVLPIAHENLRYLGPYKIPGIIKVIFTGEYIYSHEFIKMAVNSDVTCEVLIHQRPVAIVYENSDLHSAANGVFEMLYFNDNRSKKSGCSVYVQASVKEKFYSLLEEKLSRVGVGEAFTKADMCYLFWTKGGVTARDKFYQYLDKARQHQFKVVDGPEIKDDSYFPLRPTLIFDVPTTSKLLAETVPGPLIITTPFRTVKESIAMFNHTKLGSDVSVWTEKLTLALEVVRQLRTRTVWINTQNLFDASISYGGLGLSGNSIEGSAETRNVLVRQLENPSTESCESSDSYGKESPVGITLKNNPKIKLNYDLHIGGAYKKPSGGMYSIVKRTDETPCAYIALGTSADVQAAVSSAVAAQPKWQNLGKLKRIKILRKASIALASKEKELNSFMVDKLDARDVGDAVSEFHHFSSEVKYSDGQVIETESCGKVLQEHYPMGVIGIQIPDSDAVLHFVTAVVPALVRGNAVVAVMNNTVNSIPVLKVCEILQSSGVLGGTVNVITGCTKHLTRHLAMNGSIDSVWYSQADAAAFVYKSCIDHPKRIFRYRFSDDENYVLSECTFVKSIFMPQGDIFAT